MNVRLFTETKRKELKDSLRGLEDVATSLRILALLDLDAGRPMAEVAQSVGVTLRTVHRWVARFLKAGSLDSLHRQPGQGRPSLWNDDLELQLQFALDRSPIDFGYSATCWTVSLLKEHLASKVRLSDDTIRRRLHDMGYSWKRTRYILEADPDLEKKTGDSATNSGFIPQHRNFSRRRNRSFALPAIKGKLVTTRPTGSCINLWV